MRTTEWRVVRGAFSPDECAAILASDAQRQWSRADLYGARGFGASVVDMQTWDAHRATLEDASVLRRIDAVVEGLNLDLAFRCPSPEPAYWNRYGPGVGFGPHYDRIEDQSNPRVLSFVMALSGPGGCDGGELVIAGELVALAQGDAAVFSSLAMHEVGTIYSGRRDSLVRWYLAR